MAGLTQCGKRFAPTNRRRPAAHSGFTLIELAVVIAIIALMCAVAFPQLVPLIAFSKVEGEAKHAAQFGRAVIGEAALLGDTLTVYVDIDKQQYWVTKLVPAEKEGGPITPAQPDAADPLARYKQLQEDKKMDYDNLAQAVGRGLTPRDAAKLRNLETGLSDEAPEENLAAQFEAEDFGKEMAARTERSLRLRAKNVVHDDLLDDVGDVLSDADEIANSDEYVEEEIFDPIIGRNGVDEDVKLEEVRVGDVSTRRGIAQIPVSSIGLGERVVFYFSGEEDEFTALWDPATGATRVYPGHETSFAE